jgi:hypothetical protein
LARGSHAGEHLLLNAGSHGRSEGRGSRSGEGGTGHLLLRIGRNTHGQLALLHSGMNVLIERMGPSGPIERQDVGARPTLILLPLARPLPCVLIPGTVALPLRDRLRVWVLARDFALVSAVVTDDRTDNGIRRIAEHLDLARLDQTLGLGHDISPRPDLGQVRLNVVLSYAITMTGQHALQILRSQYAVVWGPSACVNKGYARLALEPLNRRGS